MAKVKIHPSTATREDIIDTNGIAILDSIVKDIKITEEFNGDFFAELNFATNINVLDQKIYDYITEEAVLTVEDEFGDEYFRISNIRKDKYNIYVFARQITIADQLTLFLKDSRPENTNGQSALSKVYNDSTGRNKLFFLESNLSNQATAYYQNMSLYNALFNADNAFTIRWGGEVYRRGFNCKINDRVGQDRGVQIKSRKNLTGFEIKSNIDDLATRIVPRGFDGIEAAIVDSPLINNYSSVYTKVMEFRDIKVKNENNPDEGYDTLEQAQQALTERAKQQFTLFNVDKIQAEYNVKFIELSRTEQYKEFQIAETVNMGDTVEVIEETYGTKIKARCIKRIYSPTLGRRLETTLSNVKKESRPISVSDIIAELEKELQTKPNANLSDYINSMINAGLKDSYVVLRPNELLIMDNKDLTKAVNVTRYNKNGLGFSTTGYYGKYEYGFTIDGKINASLITFGAMSGQYIKAGSIEADRLSVQAIEEITDKLGGNFLTKAEFEVKAGEINGRVEKTEESINSNYAEFTEFKQNSENFQIKIANSGGTNKVFNGAFESQDIRNWNLWGGITKPIVWKNNEQSGHKWACKLVTTAMQQGIEQQVRGLEFGKKYTVSMKVYSENGVVGASVRNAGVYDGSHFGGAANVWGEISFSFVAQELETYLYIGTINGKCTAGTYWVTGIQVIEGDIVKPWTSNPNESYNTNFKFDNKGLTAEFADGSYTKMGVDGFEWYDKNSMSHAYHCLIETGIFNLQSFGDGNYTRVKIQLPNYFKNKYFRVLATISGYAVGESGLDTLTAIVESYDLTNATFIVKVFAHSPNGSYQNNINISWMATA